MSCPSGSLSAFWNTNTCFKMAALFCCRDITAIVLVDTLCAYAARDPKEDSCPFLLAALYFSRDRLAGGACVYDHAVPTCPLFLALVIFKGLVLGHGCCCFFLRWTGAAGHAPRRIPLFFFFLNFLPNKNILYFFLALGLKNIGF